MPTEDYLTLADREFRRLKKLADSAVAQLTDEQFFARPGEGDNSVAIVIKHVAGNALSRWTDFLTTDGEKPHRQRDDEFIITPVDTRESVTRKWEQGWAALFAAIRPLRSADLERTVMIRGESFTVLQAVNRQLTHYAYHVGQIVYVAKHLAGPKWQTLSIPVGRSEAFNRAPRPYLNPS